MRTPLYLSKSTLEELDLENDQIQTIAKQTDNLLGFVDDLTFLLMFDVHGKITLQQSEFDVEALLQYGRNRIIALGSIKSLIVYLFSIKS
jgi:hypothetical protein